MKHLSEELINEYLDKLLDTPTQKDVEEHLATCTACRAEVEELGTLFASLAELPEVALKRDLTPGVLARLPKPALWHQPAFLMQSLLTLILVATSIPVLQTLLEKIPRVESYLTMPTFSFPTWTDAATTFALLLTWRPTFTFRLPEIVFEMPTLDLSFEPSVLFTLIAVATILWGLGNFSLLRNKPEVHG